jgi:DinB superfamily
MTKHHLQATFLKSISIWEQELNNYSFETLVRKPSEDSWSLGQVYIHLIQATLDFHLEQVDMCIKNDENRTKWKNFKGFMVFKLLKKFPPIQIKVPATDAYTPKQPVSVDEIKQGLQKVRTEMEIITDKLVTNQNKGKTAHPGFKFLNATEWYLLVGMHFEHHLNQKKRLDDLLALQR